jgi:mono/diheme cytochrome c family protein
MRLVLSLLLSVATAALVSLTAFRAATPAALAAGTVAPSDACDPAAAASDDDDGNIINGRKLYLRENCYVCHGGRGGGGMCPSLRDRRIDEDDAEDVIEEGTPDGMPAYEDRLDDDEIEDIIAYLKSLRSFREPTFTHWWEPGLPSQ